MLRIKPYVPPEHPEEPPVPVEPVEPIDIPGVDGIAEDKVKKILCKLCDKGIEFLLWCKARLRAKMKPTPLKTEDLPEIEEEDAP